MSKPRRARFVALETLLSQRRPDVRVDAIQSGRVLVDGWVVTNPAARVRADASLRVTVERRLRGDVKLSHALDTFGVLVHDRVAVDVGCSTGGFTTALLDRGARRVYAVDVGVGQLSGRLRAHVRVTNLEGVNLASLNADLVPESVQLITMDLSYLALAEAIPQLESLLISRDADLVLLVKPTFELHRGRLAAAADDLTEAVKRVVWAAELAGWRVSDTCAAPVTGQRGAREGFVHAHRVK